MYSNLLKATILFFVENTARAISYKLVDYSLSQILLIWWRFGIKVFTYIPEKLDLRQTWWPLAGYLSGPCLTNPKILIHFINLTKLRPEVDGSSILQPVYFVVNLKATQTNRL